MRWFTSDTHFGHKNIIEYCNRPFSSVEQMNEEMIKRWNETVNPNDEVFHMGDVAMGKIHETLPLIDQLNGHKILIPGNHDRIFSAEKQKSREKFFPAYGEVFQAIFNEQETIEIDGQTVALCHFPYVGDSGDTERYAECRLVNDGLFLIHGHVHDKWRISGRMFNVGVDVNDFRPVSEDTIREWMKS